MMRAALRALIAGGGIKPSIDLSFIGPTLDPMVTVSRASSNQNYSFGVDGVMVGVAGNLPRFDYDLTTHAALGLLQEESRTNVLMRASAFSNASWTRVTMTVGTDAANDLLNSLTYDSLTASAASATIKQAIASLTPGDTYAFSIDLKRLTGTGDVSISIDGGTTYQSCALTAAYQRFVVTGVVPVGGTLTPTMKIAVNADAVYAGCAQLEKGAFATSRLVTAAATILRNYDAVTVPVANPSLFKDGEFSFGFEFSVLQLAAGVLMPICRISDGTSTNRVQLAVNATSKLIGQALVGGSTFTSSSQTTIVPGTIYKGALAVGASGIQIAVNGVLAPFNAAARLPNAMTVIDIGPVTGAGVAYSRRFQFFKKVLTGSQLVAITS